MAGVIAAVVSTMSYDFFFTRPYQSLKIDNADDIGTAVLLLAIGLVVAQLASFAHQSHRRSERTHDELLRVHQVAELAAQGMAIDDLIAAVETELAGLLSLRECHYEAEPRIAGAARPSGATARSNTAGGAGSVRSSRSPPRVLRSRCSGAGASSGGSCSCPTSTSGVSIEERRAAVAIADQLGAALAADAARCRSLTWVAHCEPGYPARGRSLYAAAFSRMWMPQDEPRPMTWAMPTLAPSIWRSPASPRSCVVISNTPAAPVMPIGWPFDSRPPDTLTGMVPSRHGAVGR